MQPAPLNYHQYVEGLKAGRLPGLRCQDCGTIFTPPNGVCVNCGSRVLSIADLVPRGVIRTFTVIRVGPEGFTPPYLVAMVELAEGPYVLGNLEGVDPDAAGPDLIGRPVTVGSRIFPRPENEAGADGAALTFALAD